MVEFFPHQTAAIETLLPQMRRMGGAYIAHDPGMGKTLTSIALMRLLGIGSAIIQTPIVGIGVWQKEFDKWWPDVSVTVLRDESWNDLPKGPAILLTNYEQLTNSVGKERLRALLKRTYGMAIWDEAQYVKTPSAQRTRVAFQVAARSNYHLLLSGTPAHTPLDWWSQYRIVAPSEPMWAQRFADYKNRVAILGGPTGNWVQGFKEDGRRAALDALLPYTHVFKWDMYESIPGWADRLPPKPIYTPHEIVLSRKEADAYSQMETQLAVEVDGVDVMEAQIALTKMLRLSQITAGHLADYGMPSSKLSAAVELIAERPNSKIVVACEYLWEIRALRAAMNEAKRPWMIINGDTPPDIRKEMETSFQTRDAPFVFILQYKAGGMSLTLTRADTLILYSLDPSTIFFEQMVGRVYRIGQRTHVQVVPLLARGTQDEDLYTALVSNMDTVSMAKYLRQKIAERTGR